MSNITSPLLQIPSLFLLGKRLTILSSKDRRQDRGGIWPGRRRNSASGTCSTWRSIDIFTNTAWALESGGYSDNAEGTLQERMDPSAGSTEF